ncbi:MAG: nitroreductase family protein [Muribaculaceae bacterium]|nr:nitroreductase family protein [Muribaculaceae bacterium]
MDSNSYFANRRTVRRFTDRPVTDSELSAMLEGAFHAPTTGNMQLYSVVVTRSAEGKAALAPAHFCQPASTGCYAMLTFCADLNMFAHWCKVSDAVPGYDNLQGLLMGMLDAVIVAQQFVTIAEMRGLGTCYLGTTTYNAPDIARVLELPDHVVPVVTIAVGYPAENPSDSGRLPADSLIHFEKYARRTDDDIRSIYAEKESREDSRKFVAENGKDTLAQVFTDVRYTRDACEAFSKVYADFIRKSGFNL